MKSEYLLFNTLIITSVLLAPFIYKKTVKLNVRSFISALLPIALFFIGVDVLVTGLFWFFNPLYNLGITIFGLPIEEILFFFTVPYACLFLWVNISHAYKTKSLKVTDIIYKALLFLLLVLAILFLFLGYLYTSYAVLLLACAVLYDLLLKTHLLSDKRFYGFLILVIMCITIFNGYLTYRPVVTYTDSLKLAFEVGTIPIEDYIYGIALVYLTTAGYSFRVKKI
jgi:lycopene cyclase domain-containing protein